MRELLPSPTEIDCLFVRKVISYTQALFRASLPTSVSGFFAACTPLGATVSVAVDSVQLVLPPSTIEILMTADVTLRFRCGTLEEDVTVSIPFARYCDLHVPLSASTQLDAEITGSAVVRVVYVPGGDSSPNLFKLVWTSPGPNVGGQTGFAAPYVGPVFGAGSQGIVAGRPSAHPGALDDAGGITWIDAIDGAQLAQTDGATAGPELGQAIAGIGDVNGDGVPDALVGAPSATPLGMIMAGEAVVYSGATKSPIRSHDGAAAGDQFGWSVAGVGDVDGDGVPDYAVGAPSADPFGRTDAGSVYLYSGATGALLYRVDGLAAGDAFGFSVAGVGDINGDGVSDILVGAISTAPGGRVDAGSAYLLSGTNGSTIWTFDAPEQGDGAGWTVGLLGDVNSDGTPDLIVGAPSASPSGLDDAGTIFIVNGLSGSVIRRVDGVVVNGALGAALVGLPDLNADGVPDFAAGVPDVGTGLFTWNGQVRIFSGADGSQLQSIAGSGAGEFGWMLNALTDATQLLVGAPTESPGGLSVSGNLYAYELSSGELTVVIDVTGCLLITAWEEARLILPTYGFCAPAECTPGLPICPPQSKPFALPTS